MPKDQGRNMRLIFHLSYPRDGDSSINANTPTKFCSVHYPDFDDAVSRCLEEIQILERMEQSKIEFQRSNNHRNFRPIYIGKSDMKSAFRNLGVRPNQFCWLTMKAKSPIINGISFMINVFHSVHRFLVDCFRTFLIV